ncbi:plasmid mobilization protein [Pseudoflavonifractor phocaeensis]|uniref:plasmid mobilization protein n=1 Tax=Pseudoflavonifractor phocaeensis TaxID=1870988 RepID=UPI00195895D0|nr:ribbon-helix-helix protein, CopG family [Pseudoflavonifractor phocaeensis]MBM6724778.1 ribbon-helix-helix protein, CopG family [Pseudoflavonifractor phocaeensis]
MRKRTYGINVRVSKEEKERLERMARRCGISLSAYLRRLGMGEDLSAPHPMERFENLIQGVDRGDHQD